MRKSKVFLGLAVVFVVLMSIASYDISRKTTFPGSKPQLKERIMKQYLKKDTTEKDSSTSIHRWNSQFISFLIRKSDSDLRVIGLSIS